jgi:hypothetical protein
MKGNPGLIVPVGRRISFLRTYGEAAAFSLEKPWPKHSRNPVSPFMALAHTRLKRGKSLVWGFGDSSYSRDFGH